MVSNYLVWFDRKLSFEQNCILAMFPVVGHTKKAADRLFNWSKHKYWKKIFYMMEHLITSLDVSDCVTVILTVAEDFMNYDAFLTDLFQDLACKVKQNHIFACSEDDQISLSEINMNEHKIGYHKCSKKGCYMSAAELKGDFWAYLTNGECVGINPYKPVELHFKYGP